MTKKIENDTAAFITASPSGARATWTGRRRPFARGVSITATEALREKVIDLVAEDVPELLRKIDGRQLHLGGETRRLRNLRRGAAHGRVDGARPRGPRAGRSADRRADRLLG